MDRVITFKEEITSVFVLHVHTINNCLAYEQVNSVHRFCVLTHEAVWPTLTRNDLELPFVTAARKVCSKPKMKRKKSKNPRSDDFKSNSKNRSNRKAHQLFSRYAEGIKLSDEMMYSVTPEVVAHAQAQKAWKMGFRFVVDGCGGCGGNSIAFAETGFIVASVELNPKTHEEAIWNAGIYGVENWIMFFNEDVLDFDCKLDCGFEVEETLFYCSPEWGGPEYVSSPVFDLENLKPPISRILAYAQQQGYKKTMLYVPRTSDRAQSERLGAYECEYLFSGGWCVGCCLWFNLEDINVALPEPADF